MTESSLVRIEVPDVNGHLRGKLVQRAKLDSGAQFGFSNVIYCFTCKDEVFENPDFADERTGWSDILAVPDLETLRPVPWEPGVSAVVCNTVEKSGERLALDLRAPVECAVDRLAELGVSAKCGVEYELYLFHANAERAGGGDPSTLTPVGDEIQAYSLLRMPDLSAFLAEVFSSLDAYGASIESALTELGPGMIEIAIAPLPPLQAADAAARAKVAIKELARRHGMIASFVAKPYLHQSGVSGHVHLSLAAGEKNALWAGPNDLSKLGSAALAGILDKGREIAVFMNPYPNSYRRFVPGMWAPLDMGWGHDDRTAAVRVITVAEESARFEIRRPGGDLNPYLTIAGCLHACIHGIENDLPLPDCREVTELGADLTAATADMQSSAFVRAALGDPLVNHFVLSRQAEQEHYSRLQVDDGAVGGDPLETVPVAELSRFLNVV